MTLHNQNTIHVLPLRKESHLPLQNPILFFYYIKLRLQRQCNFNQMMPAVLLQLQRTFILKKRKQSTCTSVNII